MRSAQLGANMDAKLLNPYAHHRPFHLCASCGAPDDLIGVSCFCEPASDGIPPCSTCGAAFGEHEASCAECRRSGRVDRGLERFLDPELIDRHLRVPVTALMEEEPLPTWLARAS